jgi:transposase InsO family protein
VADGAETVAFDGQWKAEHRYRAVREVLDGAPVSEVARQYGTSRQSLHSWLRRFEAGGAEGLLDRSRRPKTSPTRVAATNEALICELRRAYPRWGPRRIAHELDMRGVVPVPSRSTVYRVLVRNGLVQRQEQRHRRTYKRWQRDAPMQLWQLDIMGGVFLADGRECKLVTGIDDHSRFVVISQIVVNQSSQGVCQAFTDAMGRYGVPAEVLTDNGKQFTGRFTRPFPVEVMFERICRENGVLARLTKPRTPTTTGKIERFHGTLRRELLDDCGPFESLATAQAAINAWVHAYNHQRPHQSLSMAAPITAFRPAPATAAAPTPVPGLVTASSAGPGRAIAQRTDSAPDSEAAEIDLVISPAGRVVLPGGNDQLKFPAAMAGHCVTVWADRRSIHVTLAGDLIRTKQSRLTAEALTYLRMRGRLAGPEPVASAAPRGAVPAATSIELDRTITREGAIDLGGQRHRLGARLGGQRVTSRLDHYLMHVIADGHVVASMPTPISPAQAAKLSGARATTKPLPPPPPGPTQVMRKISTDGATQVAGQRLHVGTAHIGKHVTVIVEDTVFRILHNDIELRAFARTTTKPITHYTSGGTARNS